MLHSFYFCNSIKGLHDKSDERFCIVFGAIHVCRCCNKMALSGNSLYVTFMEIRLCTFILNRSPPLYLIMHSDSSIYHNLLQRCESYTWDPPKRPSLSTSVKVCNCTSIDLAIMYSLSWCHFFTYAISKFNPYFNFREQMISCCDSMINGQLFVYVTSIQSAGNKP